MMINVADFITKRQIAFVLTVCLLGGIFASLGSWTSPLKNGEEALRNKILSKPVSGDIVIVDIDARSFSELPEWPWPRSYHGQLVNRLSEAGAAKIVFDISFSKPAKNNADDVAFAKAIKDSNHRTVLPAALETNSDGSKWSEKLPTKQLAEHADVASIWVPLDDDGISRIVPFSKHIGGREMPELATQLANIKTDRTGTFPIDWSFNPESFKTISYSDILSGHFKPEDVRGKRILVGVSMSTMSDMLYVPTHGRIPGMYIQATAAETLMHHMPIVVDQNVAMLLAAALVGVALLMTNSAMRLVSMFGILGLAIVTPILLIATTPIYTSGVAAIVAVFTAIATQIMIDVFSTFIARMTRDPNTGIPNLNAMRLANLRAGTTVAIRLRNQVEAQAILGTDAHADLMRRARERIHYAAGEAIIYQVDDYSFAWRTDLDPALLGDALEGIHMIFHPGIEVAGQKLDTAIAIGVSNNPKSSIDEAVSTALAAAERAVRRAIPWEIYAADDDDARWRLSLLAELDQAINNGDLWVAYQAKYNVANKSIAGAEALVRWNHPERGPIRPDHFIPIVESNGRIDRLTMFVLETAIRDFSTLEDISVAVNISPLMLGKGRLEGPILHLLEEHGMDPKRLTLEITESAHLTNNDGISELQRLREAGVSISIDDYGTGQSTLSYLKRLPATELKIDQSFIRLILTNRSDHTMVDSTVKLAHQLGLHVVAEGVETQDILEALAELGCDVIQGYHIGRPISFEEFTAARINNVRRAA